MSTRPPAILVIGSATSRLASLEGALTRIRAGVSHDELLGITIGFRGRDDLLVMLLEPGPAATPSLASLAVKAAELPGLRALDLATAGPAGSLRERALKSCSPVIDVQSAGGAVGLLRDALHRPETSSPSLAEKVAIRFDDPDVFHEVYKRDLTSGTLFVSSEGAKPPIGATIALELFVPGDPAPIRVLARVIHHGDVAGPGYGTRVALTDLARERLWLAAERVGPTASKQEVRQETRVPAKLGVTFGSGSDVARAWTQDISRGGVFVATQRPPAIGTQVELTVELPGGDRVNLAATVVRLVTREQALEWGREEGCGLSFQHLEPEIRSRLEAFVESAELKPKARVLLVDDAITFRAILGDELASRGCEVLEASNGVEAFDKLVEELFALDLLVLDLVLPNTSGTELLDRIRRLGGETELAIAVVAGSVEDPGVQRRISAAGANAVLPKSLPASEIADRLLGLLSKD